MYNHIFFGKNVTGFTIYIHRFDQVLPDSQTSRSMLIYFNLYYEIPKLFKYKKYKMLLLLILRISLIDAVPITKQSGGQYLYNYGYLLSNNSSKGKNK